GQAMNGSQRDAKSDYVLPQDIVTGWGAKLGAVDPQRDLISDFQSAGFAYAPDLAGLKSATQDGRTDKLLGLFAYSNMNVAFDKINKRRGASTIVDDYGFPDADAGRNGRRRAASAVAKKGFVAMIEGAPSTSSRI
ncbi:alkaline phosphatase, partial [Roseateles sp. GG27B]